MEDRYHLLRDYEGSRSGIVFLLVQNEQVSVEKLL